VVDLPLSVATFVASATAAAAYAAAKQGQRQQK